MQISTFLSELKERRHRKMFDESSGMKFHDSLGMKISAPFVDNNILDRIVHECLSSCQQSTF